MRRRWVWIGMGMGLMIAVLILVLAPSQSDGLDFIRRYGPKQERLVEQMINGPGLRSIWVREFEFDQIPAELIGDIWKGTDPKKSTNYGSFKMVQRGKNWFTISGQTIQVELYNDPSWLAQKWELLKGWLDRSPSPRT